VANITIDLACHLRVYGFDGASVDVGGTLVKLLDEHIYF
jgi:hypothetical protein